MLVAAARGSIANDLEEVGARLMSGALHSDLLLAVGDAVSEMDARAVRDDAPRTAEAHEAASELELFLTHVASDFSAIDDLSAEPDPRRTSPAHFDDAQREEERRIWKAWGVETRSFATVGRRPYAFEPGEVVTPWDVLHPLAPWSRLVEGARDWTDTPYLCGYRACAGGPFGVDAPAGALAATALGTSERRALERWDNDGIVNTASMLWPDGEETRLVEADHGDVIGHYRLVEALDGPPLRRYHTYDLLRSDSGFTEATFREVWRGVFEFCAGPGAGAAAAA
jgi:hypothetical protein